LKSLLLGVVLIIVGYITQNNLLIILGALLSVITFFLEKPEKVNYEFIENKPRHVVLQGKPPQDRAPLPSEIASPIGKVIYDKEVKPIEEKVKKLRIDSLVAKGDVKEKLLKDLKEAEKEYDKKLNKVSALPFGVKKEAVSPVSKLFKGIGINLSVKMISKLFDKDKK